MSFANIKQSGICREFKCNFSYYRQLAIYDLLGSWKNWSNRVFVVAKGSGFPRFGRTVRVPWEACFNKELNSSLLASGMGEQCTLDKTAMPTTALIMVNILANWVSLSGDSCKQCCFLECCHQTGAKSLKKWVWDKCYYSLLYRITRAMGSV